MFYRMQMLRLASRAGQTSIQGLMGAMLSLFPALSQFGVHDDYEEADVEDEAHDDGEAKEKGIGHTPQVDNFVRDARPGRQSLDADDRASPQNKSMENRNAEPPVGSEGEEDEEQDVDEEDDEEWEPAPTRTELLQDAVQYLRQASAEHEEQDAAAITQDEELVQVQRHLSLLESHVT